MSVEKPINFKKRTWLNPVTSYHSGSMQWSFTEDVKYNNNDVDFTLRDCSRSISLSFEIDSKKQKEATLRKLKLIINALTELEVLIENHDCDIFRKASLAYRKALKAKAKKSGKRPTNPYLNLLDL